MGKRKHRYHHHHLGLVIILYKTKQKKFTFFSITAVVVVDSLDPLSSSSFIFHCWHIYFPIYDIGDNIYCN